MIMDKIASPSHIWFGFCYELVVKHYLKYFNINSQLIQSHFETVISKAHKKLSPQKWNTISKRRRPQLHPKPFPKCEEEGNKVSEKDD